MIKITFRDNNNFYFSNEDRIIINEFRHENVTLYSVGNYMLIIYEYGAPSGPQGGPPSPPAGGPNPCANINCAQTPNHPCCQNQIPVDGYIFIPIILGLAYGTWRIYKMRKEQIV